ncbi:MAG: hypothetical protein AB1657_06150 [Candidatus Micrarchaeota archaeon]
MERKGFGKRKPGRGGPDLEMERRLRFLEKARARVAEALRSRDVMLAQLSRTVEELEGVANLMGEKLEEMYSLYFPELKTNDRKSYIAVVLNFDRDSPDPSSIAQHVGQGKALDICEKAKISAGGKLQQKDVEKIRELARGIEGVYALMESYEEYTNELAKEVCPNIEYMVGGKLAGKLVALAGSLNKLSLMPAGTIQVLGAEKALFKHLKNRKGVAPPKHGVLFQYPAISQSPKKARGKIARALAAKLSIAAKADAQTKRFIAPMLKENFEARLKQILSAKGSK